MESTASAIIKTVQNTDWKITLEFIKVLIWPIIVAGSVIYFRKNIAGLIDRITNIKGPGGTEIRAAEQKKIIESQKEASEDGLSEIKKTLKNEIEEIKNNLEVELEKEKKNGEGKDKIINNLLEQLSLKTIQLDFENIYRLIFGSQVELLKRLRVMADVGEETKNTIFMFVLTSNIYTIFKDWPFSQYVKFLFDSGLIISNNDRYLITEKGQVFLSYIETRNYPIKSL